MTKEEFEKLRALEAKATPGPWVNSDVLYLDGCNMAYALRLRNAAPKLIEMAEEIILGLSPEERQSQGGRYCRCPFCHGTDCHGGDIEHTSHCIVKELEGNG